MQIIGRSEQQAIDRLWQERTGLPLLLLMEAAAGAVSRTCLNMIREKGQTTAAILILAGKGQNGGDAMACARQLAAAGQLVILRELFPESELPAEAAANRRAALAMGMRIAAPTRDDFTSLPKGSLIVDGIFGTGFRAGRPLPPEVARVSGYIAEARRNGVRVVAIDVPSGLDADSGALAQSAIQADYTVTFVCSKIGLCAAPGRFFAGRVIVDKIGVPDAWIDEAISQAAAQGHDRHWQIESEDLSACQPVRPPDSHKGLFGKVLLLGGAPGMPGAIVLAAEAAARSGAGLVYLGVPASIGPLVLAGRPECLLTLLPDHDSPEETSLSIKTLLNGDPAVAIGPGSGRLPWLKVALPIVIRQCRRLVLDADALNVISESPETYWPLIQERSESGLPPAILTPHPGEFRRLAPDLELQDRQQAAKALARRSGCIVILKGASTVIAGPDGPILINPTGHGGLARGGSGDVLCGLIAGLLAQGLNPRQAAMCGVYLHGLAAEIAGEQLGQRAMLPGDVINNLPGAYRQIGWDAKVLGLKSE